MRRPASRLKPGDVLVSGKTGDEAAVREVVARDGKILVRLVGVERAFTYNPEQLVTLKGRGKQRLATAWRLRVRDYPNAPAPEHGGWPGPAPGTLTPNAKLLGLVLSTYMDNATGECDPAIEPTLIDAAGLGRSTIYRALAELRGESLLASRRRWNSSNVYQALLP
jgi:hypothetical protein